MKFSYFDILKAYHEFKVAKSVGSKANAMFSALLWKANVLRFPRHLPNYNSELMDLSGLTKDELYPARNKLTQLSINGLPLVRYHSKGTRKPGEYEIFYENFINYFQDCSENPTNPEGKPPKEQGQFRDYSDNPTKGTTNLHTNPQTNPASGFINKQTNELTDDGRLNGKQNFSSGTDPLNSFSEQAKTVTDYLRDRLKAKGVYIAPNWYQKSFSSAMKLINGGSVSSEQLKQCIDWAFTDEYWAKKVDSMMTIERVLPKYQLQLQEAEKQKQCHKRRIPKIDEHGMVVVNE